MLVFKRNMTRLDCTKEQFTGIRHCEITNVHEIWIRGNRVKEVSEIDLLANPRAVEDAYRDAFGFHDGQVQIVGNKP